MENISITKIRPEVIPSISQLHMIAFKGYTNTRIGTPYIRSFFRWFCEADEAIALCAIENTRGLVGYAVGAPTGYTTRLNKKVFWPAVIGMLLRPWLALDSQFRWLAGKRLYSLLRRDRDSMNDLPILPRPTFSLVAIGLHPEVRRKRVGQELMIAFETCAVEADAKSMLLSVYQDNIAARKLYEKMGWEHSFKVNSQLMYYYKILG